MFGQVTIIKGNLLRPAGGLKTRSLVTAKFEDFLSFLFQRVGDVLVVLEGAKHVVGS